jgi:hypothetical protein
MKAHHREIGGGFFSGEPDRVEVHPKMWDRGSTTKVPDRGLMSGLPVGCVGALDCPEGTSRSQGACSNPRGEVTDPPEPDPSGFTTGGVIRSEHLAPLPVVEPFTLCINEFMAAHATLRLPGSTSTFGYLVHSPWSSDYETFLETSISVYDPSLFVTRLHVWADQVPPSVEDGPYLPSSEFEAEVTRLEDFFLGWAGLSRHVV